MIVSKILNECCYLLSNFSDSNNPIFVSMEEVQNFRKRIQEKLHGLVEIMAWSFQTDQYQILVYVKDRESFEMFYRDKHKRPELLSSEIPESYLILSQEMANIMSGYAKWFNFRHQRFGSLFGRRYTKILLETEEEIERAITELHSGKKLWDFEKVWSFIWNFLKEKLDEYLIVDTSRGIYEGRNGLLNCWFSGFVRYQDWNLRGRYHPISSKLHFK